MTDNKDTPPADALSDQIRKNRIRIGGGELSYTEQRELDTLNAYIAVAIIESKSGDVDLVMQALAEMILSALAMKAETPEQFMERAHSFVKDYFLVQAHKMQTLIMEKKKLSNKVPVERKVENVYKRIEKIEGNAPKRTIGSSDALDVLLNELEAYMGDNCPCPDCVARREKEGKTQPINPSSTTKH